MPRDEYQMPEDMFDKIANLGLESVVHDDLRGRLKAHPEFSDLVIEAERALIREIANTDPDLHVARRFAKRLETELEQAEAAVAIAVATCDYEDIERGAADRVRAVESDFPYQAAELWLDLKKALPGSAFNECVHALLPSLDPTLRFEIMCRLYQLESISTDDVDQYRAGELLVQIRELVPELPQKAQDTYALVYLYKCTLSDKDRQAVLEQTYLDEGQRDLDLLCRIYAVSGKTVDWVPLVVGLDSNPSVLVSPSFDQHLILMMIEASCQHLKDEMDQGKCGTCESFIDEQLLPLRRRLEYVDESVAADIALFRVDGNLQYFRAAYKRMSDVPADNQDELQLQLVQACAENGRVKKARQSARKLSLDRPLLLVKAFAAIYAARQRQ